MPFATCNSGKHEETLTTITYRPELNNYTCDKCQELYYPTEDPELTRYIERTALDSGIPSHILRNDKGFMDFLANTIEEMNQSQFVDGHSVWILDDALHYLEEHNKAKVAI
jgi:hypothetical protein